MPEETKDQRLHRVMKKLLLNNLQSVQRILHENYCTNDLTHCVDCLAIEALIYKYKS